MENLIVLKLGLNAFKKHPLTIIEGQIFWHLTESLPNSGEVIIGSYLSKKLKISYAAVTLAIKKLTKFGFIIRGVKIGRSYHYKLNPAYFRSM